MNDHDLPSPEGPAASSPATPPAPPWSIDELVDALVVARRGGARVAAERVASAVRSTDDAYRVQALVDERLWPGAEATVWKAGADSRDSLPTAAPIAPSLVHANGAVLSSAAFPVRIVEAEIAYRFGVDLPPREVPYSTDEVAEAVATMHVAIEIVTPRIADYQTASPIAKLADHGLNGAFVLGDGIRNWRRIALRDQKATLSMAGKVVERVQGSHALGNPAVLLPWFVAHLGRLPTRDVDGNAGPPRGVMAGDVVTTGSWTKVVEARPKDQVEVVFEDVGSAAFSFVV
jgi:2-keto-4-pentenoate hydratase